MVIKRTLESIKQHAAKLQLQQSGHFIRPVLQIDPISLQVVKEYHSLKDVESEGFCRSAIIQVCQRKMRSSQNYCWCYKQDWTPNWQPLEVKFNRKDAVYCYDIDQIFQDAEEASQALNIPAQYIRKCCRHEANIAYGFQFCYLREKNTFIPHYSDANEHGVVCINTGIKYASISQAAIATNTSPSGISACCRGMNLTANNLSWCYIENYNDNLIPNTHPKPVNAKQVYQYDKKTGKYLASFLSTGDAARSLGNKSHCNIFCACTGKSKTAYGYYWSYIKADNYKDIRHD